MTQDACDAFGLPFTGASAIRCLLDGAEVNVSVLNAEGPDVWFELALVESARSRLTLHSFLTLSLNDSEARIYRGLRESGLGPRDARDAARDLAV